MSTPIIIGSVEVSHNRKEKNWIAMEGELEVARFPHGGAGKAAARVEAIRHNSVVVFNRAKQASIKNPRLSARIWSAAEDVVNHHVFEPRPGNQVNEVARVRSSSFNPAEADARLYEDDGCYSIQHRGFLVCHCEDYQFEKAPLMNSGQRACRHVLAFLVANNTGFIQPSPTGTAVPEMEEIAYVPA